MAQELPYFRFVVQEWQNGDISLESYELQGLFISVCGFYWIHDCSITKAMLQKKYRDAENLIILLIELDILKHDESTDKIQISFLNEQFDLLSEKRKRRQDAGSLGGKQKSSNAKAMLKQKGSYKIREDKIREDKNYTEIFEIFKKEYLGTKRGLDTEFKNFQKHKDWKEVIELLLPSLEKQKKARAIKKGNGDFVPEWKNLSTYINNRCWEEEINSDKTTTYGQQTEKPKFIPIPD